MTTTEPLISLMPAAFKAGRIARGWTIDEATFQARIRFPELRISRGKIHRYESEPMARDRIDISVVAALGELYGVDLADLDPGLDEEWQAVRRLAGAGIPWNPDDRPIRPRPRLMAA